MAGRTNVVCSIQTIALLAAILVPNEISGFVSQPSRVFHASTVIAVPASDTALLAKAKTKKKKKKAAPGAASGGGFGKVAAPAADAKKDKVQNHYAVFPALEPHVRETLVPTSAAMLEELESKGSLPLEIYHRLDQIYGFPEFNYETRSVEEDSSDTDGGVDDCFSFEDLLAAPKSTPASSTVGKSTTSSNDSLDLNELLAAATGGPVDTLPTNDASSDGVDENAAAIASEMKAAISSLPSFEKFRVLHVDPLVLSIDDFFTEEECDQYVEMSLEPVDSEGNQKTMDSFQTRSKTVGKDANAKSQRTSTTWFHHYKNVPALMAKASRLVGLDGIDRWEEPQTVRYQKSEKFTWHLDALAPDQSTKDLGGQRLATLLVYLKEPDSGGATMFRDLSSATGRTGDEKGEFLRVEPKKGSALLFFPAAGGIPNAPFDIRTLHCGEVVAETSETDKWISQLWLRAGQYSPTAPPGNLHQEALETVKEYCSSA